eukprot:TRINITY_DN4428_c0_g1_i1.p1 TRINITY_DN4428_c0_g1~~TRINITY_DN4428_c0_g1_i1.p1  ORF type:complete len:426 (-),score=125.80 TRINITY_DN4428_c0_g1_i1:104-1381(-)
MHDRSFGERENKGFHPHMTEIYIATGEPRRGRKRTRSRWAPPDNYSAQQSLKFVSSEMTLEQQEALGVRLRIDEITKKLSLNDLDLDYSADRSPSPEPVYDKDGKRVNTRDQRAKERLTLERHQLVVLANKMQPQFKPPGDYVPVTVKKTRRMHIPVEKFPGYNFIGLIIGPRGNTQKRMERETGVKISIRGKGSVKEGKGKKQHNPGEDEPLHVFLTGDNEVQLEKAARMVKDLLTPLEEGKNEHKRQQLRELAEINGTLRDRMWGTNPDDEASFDRAEVKCEICGDASHPTSDCNLRGKAAGPSISSGPKKKNLQEEYERFLYEIGEGPPPKGNSQDAYNDFIAALGEKNVVSAGPPAPPSESPWTSMGQQSQHPPSTTIPVLGGASNPWSQPTQEGSYQQGGYGSYNSQPYSYSQSANPWGQ